MTTICTDLRDGWEEREPLVSDFSLLFGGLCEEQAEVVRISLFRVGEKPTLF